MDDVRAALHLFLANGNPDPGREAEYERWYDERHLADVVDSIDGFVAGQRYRVADVQPPVAPPPRWQSLLLYDVESDDIDGLHASNAEFRKSPDYQRNGSLSAPGGAAWVLTPVDDVAHESWTGRADARHLLVVRSNPAAGREEEFEAWYAQHMREMVEHVDGYVAGTRYRLHPSQRPGQAPAPWQQTTIYELDSDDLVAASRSTTAAREAGLLSEPGDAIADDWILHLFTPVGPRHVRPPRPRA